MTLGKGTIAALCALIGVVAFTAGFLVRPEKRVSQAPAQEFVSKRALSALFGLQFNDYGGTAYPFSQWKGKILVINFWATWCAPCREEMPYFSRLSKEYAGKGVQFVGISADAPDTIRLFAEQHRVFYPLLVGGPQTVAMSIDLGNRQSGLPYTLILGRNGELLLARTGRLPEAELENLLKSTAAS